MLRRRFSSLFCSGQVLQTDFIDLCGAAPHVQLVGFLQDGQPPKLQLGQNPGGAAGGNVQIEGQLLCGEGVLPLLAEDRGDLAEIAGGNGELSPQLLQLAARLIRIGDPSGGGQRANDDVVSQHDKSRGFFAQHGLFHGPLGIAVGVDHIVCTSPGHADGIVETMVQKGGDGAGGILLGQLLQYGDVGGDLIVIPVFVDQKRQAEALVAGLELLSQGLPLFFAQLRRRADQADAGCGIMDGNRVQLHHQAPKGLQHGLCGGGQIDVADLMAVQKVIQAAKPNDQQIHLSAVPHLQVVVLQRLIPIVGVHMVPVDGGFREKWHAVLAKDGAKIHRSIGNVKIHPAEIRVRVLDQKGGDELIVVPVGNIEVGIGLLHLAEHAAEDLVGVGAAEQKSIKLIHVLLVEKLQVLRRGIGQVGNVALPAHFLIDVHDIFQRLGGGKNTDGIHGTVHLIWYYIRFPVS